MKRILFAFVAMMLCALAFALPSPKQIEDALAAHKYADAKSMVQEVLREKPSSARAHLLNAHLLIHADHNRAAANAELQTAAGLDLEGDVKRSPLFGRVVAEIDMRPAAAGEARSLPAHHAYATWDFVTAFLIMLSVLAAVAIIAWIIDRNHFMAFCSNHPGASGARASSPVYPDSPAPAGSQYPQAVGSVVVAQQQPAMGAFGTAASVAGGVVAGNLMSDALMHRHHIHDANDDYEERQRRRRREEDSKPPTYDPSPVSCDNERSSFSSGSSDSWGSSDSGSSSSSDSDGSGW